MFPNTKCWWLTSDIYWGVQIWKKTVNIIPSYLRHWLSVLKGTHPAILDQQYPYSDIASFSFISSSLVHSPCFKDGSRTLTHLQEKENKHHSRCNKRQLKIKNFYLSLHWTWVLPGTNWAIRYQLLYPKRVTATLKRLSSSVLHLPTLCLAGSKVLRHLINNFETEIQRLISFPVSAWNYIKQNTTVKDHKTRHFIYVAESEWSQV